MNITDVKNIRFEITKQEIPMDNPWASGPRESIWVTEFRRGFLQGEITHLEMDLSDNLRNVHIDGVFVGVVVQSEQNLPTQVYRVNVELVNLDEERIQWFVEKYPGVISVSTFFNRAK